MKSVVLMLLLLAAAPANAQQGGPSAPSSPAVPYDEGAMPSPEHKTNSGQVDQAISDDELAPPPSGQNSDAANADLCRHLTAEQRKKNPLCKTPH